MYKAIFLVVLMFCTSAAAEEQLLASSEADAGGDENAKEKGDESSEAPGSQDEQTDEAPPEDQHDKEEDTVEEPNEPKHGDSTSADDSNASDDAQQDPTGRTDAGEKSTEEDHGHGFEGIVLDPTGKPVVGARVSIESLGITVTSAEDGTVVIEAAPGTYTVRVEAENLEPLEEEVVLDESAAMSGFELLMEFPMGDVVVTGTKTEKLVEKAPVKTQVISREKIERKKAATLADTLETTSGVRVENNCQNCNFTQVRLNGLEGCYTQILIDGNPVFSSLAGVYGLEQIPEEMIERVEIVKGGGSALYGGNAVGGVVNVITSRPKNNFANFTLRGGAVGMGEPEFRLGANAGVVSTKRDLALHVFGGAHYREPWDANGDGFSEIGKVRQVMVGAESYMDVVRDGELQAKFHVLQEQRRGGDSFDKPEHDAAIAESTHTMRYGGELRFHRLVNSHFNYDLGYGFAYTERDSYYGGGGDLELSDPPTAEQWKSMQVALGAYGKTRNPVHTGDATMNFAYTALGEQIITVGGQYLSDGLDDKFPGYGRQMDERYWDLGGVLQHDWMYTDWAESVIGVRIDKHSELDDPVISPRAALMFTPFDWLRTRTSFSTGFRAPQVFDEDLHITIVGGKGQIVYNDPDLGPERSYSLAQQIELDFDLKNDWKLKTSVNGFWTRITDAFVIDEDDDPATVGEIEMYRRNLGDTTVYGAELEAGVDYDNKWGLSTGWTWERAESSEDDPDFGTKQSMRTPDMYGFVETWVKPASGLELSTNIDFTGPMKVPHYAGYIAENTLEESPWFADWSANVSYRIDLSAKVYLTPYVGIRNILDSRQDDYDIGPERDAGYVYGPRLPRTFFAGIKGGI